MSQMMSSEDRDPEPGLRSTHPDWAGIRRTVQERSGRHYWKSIEELADSAEFEELTRGEFALPPAPAGAIDRRNFFRLMAASLALAGLAGCSTKPREAIVPYVRSPEELVPGKPLFFATAMTLGGSAIGVLVETHEGRPTKIEGNPTHPASLGASDIYSQASLLTLYDPDRSGAITYRNDIRPWNNLLQEIRAQAERQRLRHGAGLRLLTESIVSPTLAFQIHNLLKRFPEARWIQHEAVSREAVRQGSQIAFGRSVQSWYRIDKADVIVSFDSDFLARGQGCVRYARDFASRRRPDARYSSMSRFYAVECEPTSTGAKADHRISARPSEMAALARSLFTEIGRQSQAAGSSAGSETTSNGAAHENWLQAAAKDLLGHRGASLVIAGEHQTADVHASVHRLNYELGNVGTTVVYTESIESESSESLNSLCSDLDAGKVDWLVILGANPVFTAPVDFDFAKRMRQAPVRMHLGLYPDETAAVCQWHIPEAHYLEAWSDTRSFDGTGSIVQPCIAPLWNGKSAHELIAAVAGEETSGYELVRDFWKGHQSDAQFESFWRRSLNDGVIAGSSFSPLEVGRPKSYTNASEIEDSPSLNTSDEIEIAFRPDPTIYDGRFANNGWLQELPKPITQLTWDNAALISPAMAEKLGVGYRIGSTGGERGNIEVDMVELRVGGRFLRIPAWIVPGHADNSITLHLGYGRTRAGRVGTSTGFNAYSLRTAATLSFARAATIRRTGEQYPLACVQFHNSMEGRDLVRSSTLDEFQNNPFPTKQQDQPPPSLSLYPHGRSEGYAWGMTIDLNSCVGCSACVAACQAENNIPIVGKTEVMRGREMHWIRIDQYQAGPIENPERFFQPVPCMQCENAPCEEVCPVGATVHSAEGLNDMVYNRCVGTRYCSNNCPYKVRRFNFLQYSDWDTPSLELLRNPNVTVRSRGVMEKCTYCVQRINAGRIGAEKEDRLIRDGEIKTACQQACPAQAITFGNINDPGSLVAQLKQRPRNYALLGELGTRPRTTYLEAVRNPSSEYTKSEQTPMADERTKP